MDIVERDEFLKSYRNISAQLKRKFVRKPNVCDAVEAYETLGRQQLDLGYTEMSAACRLAAAKLEQAMGPNPGSRNCEHNLYLDSARSFSLSKNLIQVSSCYESAINSTTDESLACMASMEAGEVALQNEDYSTSIMFFTRALHLADNDTFKRISGEKLASSYIQLGMFKDAIKVLQQLQSNNSIQLTKLLLALNLRKHVNGEAKSSKTIQDIFDESKIFKFAPQEINYTVKALIDKDSDYLDLVSTVWKYLSKDQKQLLSILCIMI